MSHRLAMTDFQVIARSPFEIHYEGQASAVSACNRVGQFDILPGHADFFSMMTPGEVAIETPDGVKTFYASNGIITVHSGKVMLFVNM